MNDQDFHYTYHIAGNHLLRKTYRDPEKSSVRTHALDIDSGRFINGPGLSTSEVDDHVKVTEEEFWALRDHLAARKTQKQRNLIFTDFHNRKKAIRMKEQDQQRILIMEELQRRKEESTD